MCKDSIIHVRSEAACSSNVSVAPMVSSVIPINPLPQWMWLCSTACGCTQNKNCNWFMPQYTVDTGPQVTKLPDTKPLTFVGCFSSQAKK